MIEKEEYAKACKEVLEVLKVVREEDLIKIPKEEIQILKEKASATYEFSYNSQKDIKEQQVSKLAKAILANFFIDYIATPSQKQKIINKQNYDIKVLEEMKTKDCKTKQILKNKQEGNKIINNSNELPIEIKKVNFITKLFKKIKKSFNL